MSYKKTNQILETGAKNVRQTQISRATTKDKEQLLQTMVVIEPKG